MTIYIIILIIIFIMGAIFRPERKEKGKVWFIILSFILLTFVSGMRAYSVGADTTVYVRLYNIIAEADIGKLRYEYLFCVYLKILRFFSSDPRLMLFVSSIICIGSYCYFAYRFSKNTLISMVLYITLSQYFSQMNIIRQAIAMSFIMLSFSIVLDSSLLKKHKIIKSVISALLIIVAMGFHTVSVIAFVPWIIILRHSDDSREYKYSMQYVVLLTVLLCVAVFFGYSLIMRISSALFTQKSDFYFNSKWGDANYFGSLINGLVNASFFAVGSIAFRGRVLTKLQRFGAIMLGMTLIFNVLSMRMEFWGRIASLFGVYTALIWVPEFLSVIENKSNVLIIKSAIIVLTFLEMLTILVLRPEWSGVVPYVFG